MISSSYLITSETTQSEIFDTSYIPQIMQKGLVKKTILNG